MAISRSQIKRQLRMGGGIMEVTPRQGALFGGLKKAVKGVAKGIGSFLKSDLGKAAIIGAGAFGIPGTSFGGLFGKGALANIIGQKAMTQAPFAKGTGIKGFLQNFLGGEKTLGKTLGVMAGGTVLGGVLAGLDPQEEEEITSGRDLGALRSKLTKAYQDLGYDEEEIPSLVANDMSEYTKDMSRGMADGGRIGYAGGTKMASADNPFFRSDYADEHSYRMFGKPYKNLTPSELEEFEEEMDRLRNKFMADGGRVNYADGTEDLTKDRQYKLWAKRYEQNPKSMLVQGHENYNKYKEFYDRENKAMGGRMKYAMGDTAEQNAVQAAGIMNLPLNQNSAGVTELDLRKTGGFIPPVGVKEKADDIPAMLSNNEFVFTADAVRAAGGGSVNKGAQRMYDLMKNLESKVV
jgi:hypothetical protein